MTAQQMIKLFKEAFECTPRKPFALGFLGPNGSGKTCVERELGIGDTSLEDRVRGGRAFVDEATGKLGIITVNADDYAHKLLEDNSSMSVDEANKMAQEWAAHRRELLMRRHADFSWESVASHPSKVDYMRELKTEGYLVGTAIVSTDDPQINVRRVESRSRFGGHDVPPDKVVSRYHRFSELIPEFYRISDLIAIYDNSRESNSPHQPSARLLLVKHSSGVFTTPACKEVSWIHRYLLDVI